MFAALPFMLTTPTQETVAAETAGAALSLSGSPIACNELLSQANTVFPAVERGRLGRVTGRQLVDVPSGVSNRTF